MGGTIKVSVVIPARNEEEFIRSALDSVVSQNYPFDMLECVVVDNGSTDSTAAKVIAFAREHQELEVRVVHEPKAGVATAKNNGAREGVGAVVVFLDADSRMQPNLTGDIAALYMSGMAAGSIRVIADSRDWLERGFFEIMELGKRLFGIRTQMAYCDRQLFLKLGGFREDLCLAEDLEFLKRVANDLHKDGGGLVTHVQSSAIATSPRRLRALPCRLSIITVFVRWALAFAGLGRSKRY